MLYLMRAMLNALKRKEKKKSHLAFMHTFIYGVIFSFYRLSLLLLLLLLLLFFFFFFFVDILWIFTFMVFFFFFLRAWRLA